MQTFNRRRVPGLTSARTVWMFGFHRRLVRRWECETDMPKLGLLAHTSQTAATSIHSWSLTKCSEEAQGKPWALSTG